MTKTEHPNLQRGLRVLALVVACVATSGCTGTPMTPQQLQQLGLLNGTLGPGGGLPGYPPTGTGNGFYPQGPGSSGGGFGVNPNVNGTLRPGATPGAGLPPYSNLPTPIPSSLTNPSSPNGLSGLPGFQSTPRPPPTPTPSATSVRVPLGGSTSGSTTPGKSNGPGASGSTRLGTDNFNGAAVSLRAEGLVGLVQPGQTVPSPVSSLPPPGELEAGDLAVFRDLGIRVAGSAATPEMVRRVAAGFRYLKPSALAGLREVVVMRSSGSTTGQWNRRWDAATKEAYTQIYFYVPKRPRQLMMLDQDPLNLRTVTHEAAHNWAEHADVEGGQRFLAALGPGPEGIVSPYASKSLEEQVADGAAYLLVGTEEFQKEMSVLAAWNPPVAARDVLKARAARR